MRAYEVDENGWTWMPVEDILQKTHSACDFPGMHRLDWERILENKCGDTGFMHLVWSIVEHGWKSAVGWCDGEITEGHHRICAAILLCEELIPVTDNSTDWEVSAYENMVDAHDNWSDPQPLDLWEF